MSALPDWLIQEDLEAGRLVRGLPQWKLPDLAVHVVFSCRRLRPSRVRAFIDFAVTRLQLELQASKAG